jgi:hypothetical protein
VRVAISDRPGQGGGRRRGGEQAGGEYRHGGNHG